MPVDTPLFSMNPSPGVACMKCRDFGLWYEPNGFVVKCPSIQAGDLHHPEPSPAAKMVHSAVELVRGKKFVIDSRTFDIVRTLAEYSSLKPCSREDLLTKFFNYLPMSKANQLRKFHAVIEDLRKVWLLPVGSRKDSPSGYWIITDQKDFEEWFDRTKAAPITQLTTIHRVAKRNFPIFAEQLELEFFNDQDPPPTAVAA